MPSKQNAEDHSGGGNSNSNNRPLESSHSGLFPNQLASTTRAPPDVGQYLPFGNSFESSSTDNSLQIQNSNPDLHNPGQQQRGDSSNTNKGHVDNGSSFWTSYQPLAPATSNTPVVGNRARARNATKHQVVASDPDPHPTASLTESRRSSPDTSIDERDAHSFLSGNNNNNTAGSTTGGNNVCFRSTMKGNTLDGKISRVVFPTPVTYPTTLDVVSTHFSRDSTEDSSGTGTDATTTVGTNNSTLILTHNNNNNTGFNTPAAGNRLPTPTSRSASTHHHHTPSFSEVVGRHARRPSQGYQATMASFSTMPLKTPEARPLVSPKLISESSLSIRRATAPGETFLPNFGLDASSNSTTVASPIASPSAESPRHSSAGISPASVGTTPPPKDKFASSNNNNAESMAGTAAPKQESTSSPATTTTTTPINQPVPASSILDRAVDVASMLGSVIGAIGGALEGVTTGIWENLSPTLSHSSYINAITAVCFLLTTLSILWIHSTSLVMQVETMSTMQLSHAYHMEELEGFVEEGVMIAKEVVAWKEYCQLVVANDEEEKEDEKKKKRNESEEEERRSLSAESGANCTALTSCIAQVSNIGNKDATTTTINANQTKGGEKGAPISGKLSAGTTTNINSSSTPSSSTTTVKRSLMCNEVVAALQLEQQHLVTTLVHAMRYPLGTDSLTDVSGRFTIGDGLNSGQGGGGKKGRGGGGGNTAHHPNSHFDTSSLSDSEMSRLNQYLKDPLSAFLVSFGNGIAEIQRIGAASINDPVFTHHTPQRTRAKNRVGQFNSGSSVETWIGINWGLMGHHGKQTSQSDPVVEDSTNTLSPVDIALNVLPECIFMDDLVAVTLHNCIDSKVLLLEEEKGSFMAWLSWITPSSSSRPSLIQSHLNSPIGSTDSRARQVIEEEVKAGKCPTSISGDISLREYNSCLTAINWFTSRSSFEKKIKISTVFDAVSGGGGVRTDDLFLRRQKERKNNKKDKLREEEAAGQRQKQRPPVQSSHPPISVAQHPPRSEDRTVQYLMDKMIEVAIEQRGYKDVVRLVQAQLLQTAMPPTPPPPASATPTHKKKVPPAKKAPITPHHAQQQQRPTTTTPHSSNTPSSPPQHTTSVVQFVLPEQTNWAGPLSLLCSIFVIWYLYTS